MTRADVRDLDGNCGEEEAPVAQGYSRCGVSSSDSVVSDEKATSPDGRSSNHSASTAKSSSSDSSAKRIRKQKKFVATRAKRKSAGEDSVINSVSTQAEDESVSDEENSIPGPSTSSDVHFGYEPSEVVPWATKSYYPLSIEGLHEEIVDCWQWIRPTRLETAIRYKVYEKVRDMLIYYWRPFNVRVSLFGSLRTKLFLPSSDIDILVECDEWIGYDDQKLLLNVMTYTMKCLQVHLDMVSFNAAAFVPILKFNDRDTKLNLDISFNTVQGVKAATYMSQVKNEFPVLEPLLLLLKTYIFQNRMHEAYSGGLSSYGISLMLVNFFQIHYPALRHKDPESEDVNLGYLFMRFLEVYGHELNYAAVAIDPSINRYRRRSECTTKPSAAAAPAGSAAGTEEGEGSEEGESGGSQTAESSEEGPAAAAAAAAAHAAPATGLVGCIGVPTAVFHPPPVPKNAPPVLFSVHDPLHEGNEVCRASFNIYTVRTLFQSALAQLKAVFVSDRPASASWRKNVYKGTMLGRLLHISPTQINFRYWLKGFLLSRPVSRGGSRQSGGAAGVIYGSLLSAPSDVSCLARIPKGGGHRVLEIKRPDDMGPEEVAKPQPEGGTRRKSEDELQHKQQQAASAYYDAAAQQMHQLIQLQLLQQQQQQQQQQMVVQQPQQQPQPQLQQARPYTDYRSWTPRGGFGARGRGGYHREYQREYRYGHHNGYHNNGGNGGHYHRSNYYNNNHQSGGLHNNGQYQQHYGGGYNSKTWERIGGGHPRRFYDDRTKSRSSEMLSSSSSDVQQVQQQLQRPPPSLTPQGGGLASLAAAPAAAAAASTFSAAAATAPTTTMSYQRSDSAVSSASTTVIGTSSCYTSASASLSSPAINGCGPPSSSGYGGAVRSGSTPSSSSSSVHPLSRHRGERMSGRGEVYKPPAARKAAEAAAAAAASPPKKKEMKSDDGKSETTELKNSESSK